MKYKYIAILFLVLLPLFGVQAQQDAQYTQYMYNTMSVNPAYAGSRGALSITALYRSQWVGLDGAPETQTLNVNSPISEKVGLGLSVVNDKIGNGTNQDTYIDGAFSYTVKTSETGNLSFGVKTGAHLLSIDFNKLRNYTGSSTIIGEDQVNKFSINFGAGVYYHTNKFYAGLSVPNFLKTEHFNDSASTYLAEERLNLYLISGYVFDLNANTKFKPTLLLKAVNGAPLQMDISANFKFNDKFTVGAAYRWDAAVSALFGFQISDQLMLGMAYDKETTALGNTEFNDGSFEVFLRFELIFRDRNLLSPRFF